MGRKKPANAEELMQRMEQRIGLYRYGVCYFSTQGDRLAWHNHYPREEAARTQARIRSFSPFSFHNRLRVGVVKVMGPAVVEVVDVYYDGRSAGADGKSGVPSKWKAIRLP